jgi:hypothetical protein
VRVSRRKATVIAGVVTPVLVIVTLLLYQFVYLGKPLLDEWHCSKGEAPIEFHDGGRACLPVGSELPAGATWDPFGNRPFSCDSRRGWTVIHRGDIKECLRNGLEAPTGWSQ